MTTYSSLTLVDYDPRWTAAFAAEKSRILGRFTSLPGAPPAIEHIGSTAVPGLAAKPVIDIMLGLPATAAVPHEIGALRSLGYGYLHARKGRLCLYRGQPRSHFIHLVAQDGPEWAAQLLFRDYLRANPGTATAYGALKQRLAGGGASSGDYSREKHRFILETLARARRWQRWQ